MTSYLECPPEMKESYPLHRFVWRDQSEFLNQHLHDDSSSLEEKDPQGRTPLMLAVTLGHSSCAKALISHNADTDKCVNSGGWNLVQESVSRGIPEVLQSVLETRDRQRQDSRKGWIPRLLNKLMDAPDFYVEMKWEFTSWLPLFSRWCPSDVYKIYKRGSHLRIDTTLLCFDTRSWARGNRSYILSPGSNDTANILKIDHDNKTYHNEKWDFTTEELTTSDRQITSRQRNPLIFTFLDTEKIHFERSKTSSYILWGSSDKYETISGYNCKVFAANNVELVTKTRIEHLSEERKRKVKSESDKATINNPLLNSLLSRSEVDESSAPPSERVKGASDGNPYGISESDYFNPDIKLNHDVGIPKEMTTRVQKFKAQLWLSEEYPLSLQEQIMPIIDLLSITNTHYQKLKDFFTLQFPSGFPVKIEIPIFHALNSRVTFENIFGMDKPVQGVDVIQEDASRLTAVVDDSVFSIPSGYSRMGEGSFENDYFGIGPDDDEDRFLQYAISQSMSDGEEEEIDIYEALRSPTHLDSYLDIKKAIEASFSSNNEAAPGATGGEGVEDPKHKRGDVVLPESKKKMESSLSSPLSNDLELAIALSQKDQDNIVMREREEQEILERILALSMMEK
uniref:Ankyrin repeat domaincontaining protein 13Blike [Megachile rotundata] n=1 Tax=Lepeophtheirus salmonis TaxID=72036 RepID=A0A0K2T0F6_LEPSM